MHSHFQLTRQNHRAFMHSLIATYAQLRKKYMFGQWLFGQCQMEAALSTPDGPDARNKKCGKQSGKSVTINISNTGYI
jgi:hypothetical protein